MDNLTHSLIGAALGQAGLKRKTGLAMPALIIGANLPDIDAGCVLYGLESLAMRRGITHGPIGLVLLPLLLTLILVGFDRWQAKRGKRPEGRAPVRPGGLFALSFIACLTHPAMDWLNNYGIRLLEPFSHQWFYGDTLFIIDVWILAMLGVGIWLSLKRERAGMTNWMRPARAALAGMAAYICLNMAISTVAAHRVRMDVPYPRVAVANAVPLAFWRRDVLWRTQEGYGAVPYSLFGRRIRAGESEGVPTNMADPRIAEWSKGNPSAEAFLFWSRMPIAEPGKDGIILRDQRFLNPITANSFSVLITPRK